MEKGVKFFKNLTKHLHLCLFDNAHRYLCPGSLNIAECSAGSNVARVPINGCPSVDLIVGKQQCDESSALELTISVWK